MRRLLILCLLIPVICRSAEIHHIKIDGAINPVSSEYLSRAIERAESEHAALLIVEMDTPGGLMTSMRKMVKEMLSAEVPIAVYVSPSGARAGSAGVFITLAAHIAVMAPGTNIGAAHPVNMGGQMDSTMNKKVTNDAVAFARSIAAQRGRNEDWAEAAVRESASITANDALEKSVIDIIASDYDELIDKINGRKVQLPDEEVTLQLDDYSITFYDMDWRQRILNTISDPNIAYILLMLGMYGLLFELYNPGAIFPGVIGGICLILALFAMHTLPVNYAGLLLIILAVILFILEIKIVSYGGLTLGGIISLLLGSIMLYKGVSIPEVRVSWSVLIPTVAATSLFFIIAIGFGAKAQIRKPTYGRESLIGREAKVVKELKPEGLVKISGELWRAVGDAEYEKGETLIVKDVKDMQLVVGKKEVKS
ncbi:nodulation protein NfeD [bacterium]|nr:nodulation protein NfeD [bacterium]